MIPKIIHYCWFGKSEMPEISIKCLESWKLILPDWTFMEWNEGNSPLENAFVQKALAKKSMHL
jgi:mannosyltransferase OCH1-like enzyme